MVHGLSSIFREEMLFKYVYCSMNMNYDKIYPKNTRERERERRARKSSYLSSRKFVVTAKYTIVGAPPEGTSTFGSTRMSRKLKIGRGGTRPY